MSSRLAEALSLRYEPLALYYARQEPAEARSFRKKSGVKGGWGCAMFLLGQALGGQTVSFSQDTCRCPGAAAGLGLTEANYDNFPGGVEAFCYFLSSGNENREEGLAVARKLKEGGAGQEMLEDYLKGEGFKKNPDLAMDYMGHIPQLPPPKGPYVILEPLSRAWAQSPEVVIMLGDAVQISALTYQANFARKGLDNVLIPFCSGCQSIGVLPLFEQTRESPKAVLGLVDISSRLYLRKILGRDLLSFAMPRTLFQEMEANAGESFLARGAWRRLNG
ncbi:MAG: DUF169 domain-containing protein [Candidatus Adiutrix sp.]|jgi:uncharacterized protein (DUF169 family)|nr:DUF169 domain-containing protein [Candidatus Adiutrix sp.]